MKSRTVDPLAALKDKVAIFGTVISTGKILGSGLLAVLLAVWAMGAAQSKRDDRMDKMEAGQTLIGTRVSVIEQSRAVRSEEVQKRMGEMDTKLSVIQNDVNWITRTMGKR